MHNGYLYTLKRGASARCGGKYRQKHKKNYFCCSKYFVRRLEWLN